jgi:hypothetical protein
MFDWSLYNRITKSGLTPDQYFYLGMLLTKKQKKTHMVIPMVKRMLVKDGYLTETLKPTEKLKGLELYTDFETKTVDDYFKSEETMTNIEKYQAFFPAIIIPNNRPCRRSIKELSDKFDEFFKLYKVSWDDILDATRRYTESVDYRGSDAKYLKDSASFIYDSKEQSLLYAYCISKEEKVSFSKDL